MVAPGVQNPEKPAVHPDEVVIQQPTPPEPEPQWTSFDLAVASIGFLCCQLIGLPALVMAMFSYVDHGNKHFTESSRKRKRARCLGILAIVLGTLLVMGFIAWRFCPKKYKYGQGMKEKFHGKDWGKDWGRKEGDMHRRWPGPPGRPGQGRPPFTPEMIEKFRQHREEMKQRMREERERREHDGDDSNREEEKTT